MITAVLVGAGQRGHHVYGDWALRHPDRLRFVAVADPRPDRRTRFGGPHALPEGSRFASTEELFEHGRLADACFIAAPDRHHVQPAAAALAAGYHVLLEKPMAPTLDEVIGLARTAVTTGGSLHVAHVLRFTPFFSAVHQVVRSGRLGDVVTVEHRENVVAWHMAHSYVRGNWAREGDSAPMIVAKCCHDFDILHWNLDDPVVRLSSFGSLVEFRPERAPRGATPRCTDPCPVADCPYDARRVYLNPAWTGWPVHVVTDDLSTEARLEALLHGPYGRCVYTAGSDVVDHQVVAMESASGRSMVLVMHGHSDREERTMRYDGTRATLRGVFGRRQQILVADHASGDVEEIPIASPGGGHGGGDEGLIEAFIRSVETGERPLTSAAESVESHLLAFLAEEARVTGRVIDTADARARLTEV